jgi:hypothetical protein
VTRPESNSQPRDKHSGPAPEYVPPVREVTFGLSYGVIGLAVISASALLAVGPWVLAAEWFGDNWGLSLGCAVSVAVQLGILLVLTRFPGTPGAVLVRTLSMRLMLLEALLAPIGVAEALIPLRWLAALVGFAIGVLLIAESVRLLRRTDVRVAPEAGRER